jgi:hypothetical protein
MDLAVDDFANLSDIALRPTWQRKAACRGRGTEFCSPSTTRL